MGIKTVNMRVTGCNIEEMLCIAAERGVSLSNIERIDRISVRLDTFEGDAEILKSIAERNMCSAEYGSSRTEKAKKRIISRAPIIMIAALLTVCAAISSLFIWRVEVVGNENVSSASIIRTMSDCSVAAGEYWPALKADEVRNHALELLPDIAWLTVNVRGSAARVIVIERGEKAEIYDPKEKADIIAKSSGVITKMTVLNGYTDFKPGSAVKAGDTLVSGLVSGASDAHIGAKGKIIAETLREITAVTPAFSYRKGEITERTRIYSLKIGKKQYKIFSNAGKGIDGCDKIYKEYYARVDGLFELPIALVVEECFAHELLPAGQQSAKEAERRAYTYLTEMIDGEVVEYECSAENADNNITVKITAKCCENIGETVYPERNNV